MNDTNATAIFAPIWRRKWLILTVGIVLAAASYLYYKRKTPVYQVSTQVYLGTSSEEQVPGEKGVASKTSGTELSNDVAVINQIVVESVHQQLAKEHKGKIAKVSTVKAKAIEKTTFITISVESNSAKHAALVANLTAQVFIKRVTASRQRAIERQIAINRRQLRRLEVANAAKAPKSSSSKGSTTSTASPSTESIIQQANLSTKINQLESSLTAGGPQQVKLAKPSRAVQVAPKPRSNAEFGFVLGIVLASIAAYAMGRFDRRLRSLPDIEAAFESQLLAGLPQVRRPIVHREGQPVPSALLLEPLRRLHTGLQLAFASDARLSSSRVILVTSADAGDGKSTVVADLALVQRDAGATVAVVEANFRRSVQTKLLGLDASYGLADVLAGALPVEDAMQRVLPAYATMPADSDSSTASVATAVQSPSAGSLFLLAGGGGVPNPPALMASEGMTDLLRSVGEDFDYVLVDAPSPVEVSDVMPLLGVVDAIVVIARSGYTRQTSARRLLQLLTHQSHAPILGSVANCVRRKEAERYGFAPVNERGWPSRLIRR